MAHEINQPLSRILLTSRPELDGDGDARDAEQLRLVIANLVRNAVEALVAAGATAREVEVAVERTAEGAVLTVGRSLLGGAEFRIVLPVGGNAGGVRRAEARG